MQVIVGMTPWKEFKMKKVSIIIPLYNSEEYIEKTICSVAEALKNCSAATCGVRVKDTIKQTDKNGKILKTVDRSCLFSVQTPQAVRKADYLSAVEKIGDISSFTDDTSIMEAAGYDCFMVEGDYKNIKITTREDIPLAENFLKEEEI